MFEFLFLWNIKNVNNTDYEKEMILLIFKAIREITAPQRKMQTAAVEAETSLGQDNFLDVIDCILTELVRQKVPGSDSTILSPEEFQNEKYFFENSYKLIKYDYSTYLK